MRYRIILYLTFYLLGVNTLKAQDWYTDYQEALKVAKQKDQPVILVFQGSDWCKPCIKLEKNVWSTEVFGNYAKNHWILLLADFPRKKKNELSQEQQEKNYEMAERYNKKGRFPLVVLLDAEGSIIAETGYKNISDQEYIHHLQSLLKTHYN